MLPQLFKWDSMSMTNWFLSVWRVHCNIWCGDHWGLRNTGQYFFFSLFFVTLENPTRFPLFLPSSLSAFLPSCQLETERHDIILLFLTGLDSEIAVEMLLWREFTIILTRTGLLVSYAITRLSFRCWFSLSSIWRYIKDLNVGYPCALACVCLRAWRRACVFHNFFTIFVILIG